MTLRRQEVGKPIAATDPLGPGPFGFDESFSVSNWFDLDWTFSPRENAAL